MSIRAINRVWENSMATGADLLVMLALADFADEYGRSYPSTITLARKARVNERTAHRAVNRCHGELCELDVKYGTGPNGVNEYWVLCFDAPPGKMSPPAIDHPGMAVSSLSPNPSGTVEPSLVGVTSEIPSKEEVLAEAKTYAGCPAIGAPADIPELWALRWYAGKLQYQKCNWSQWRYFMRLEFEIAFRRRDSLALEGINPSPAASVEGQEDHMLIYEQLRIARAAGDGVQVKRLEEIVRRFK